MSRRYIVTTNSHHYSERILGLRGTRRGWRYTDRADGYFAQGRTDKDLLG